jgi:hypothetical protein
MRVQVYRNLHLKCWSVKNMKTQRVILHPAEVYILGARFIVSQTGRERVMRERCKNVHAGVRGQLSDSLPTSLDGWLRVTYNPYHHSSFVFAESGEAVLAASEVFFDKTGKVYARA